MLRGAQRGIFDLDFRTPAECADALQAGEADVGIVPAVEVVRQNLQVVPGAGIACDGEVRSILLISRVPAQEIRTLATDSSSRTSVLLARVILEEKFRAVPEVVSMPPDLDRMLAHADAALIIGDHALEIDPGKLPYRVWDLGEEWKEMTGLPMVFALWAGPAGRAPVDRAGDFVDSYRFGMEHLEDIVREQAPVRGLPESLIRDYLTRNLTLEIGPREREGLRAFLSRAARFDMVLTTGRIPA